MSGFHSTLLIDEQPLSVEQVREWLGNETLVLQAGDYGTLQYRSESEVTYTLILHDAGAGKFALTYDVYAPRDHSCNIMWVTQGEGDMSNFIQLPLGDIVPEGSLMSDTEAKAAMRQFLEEPEILPSSQEWKNGEELAWPEETA